MFGDIYLGVKVCMMVELCPRTTFSPLVALSLGVTERRVEKGAPVDYFWPLIHRFLPFDREYLENDKSRKASK